ncbi:hypothetical protein F5146DRAFT_507220 [Armillaria mellea]|nr:hypothetical protein F5146DRAFT_507220 [Armillaria mellea]
MVVVIILLHALITINFAAHWSYISSAFIENGQSFFTAYLELIDAAPADTLTAGISASMSSILTDLYMIWCCWIIWGRRWLVVLLPIFSIIFATGSKIIAVCLEYFGTYSSEVFSMVYILSLLTTTLWCTLLIIYRVLTVAGVSRGAEGRQRVYHRFLEALLESSALYSIALIPDLALTFQADNGMYYIDVIASIAKGVAPTLIVGRITVVHRARSDNSWQGSVIGSASIRSRSQGNSQTNSREASSMLDGDLEAQRESSVREPSLSLRSVSAVADYAHANTDASPETSPYLRNPSLRHDRSSIYEDATYYSTVVDEATALSR